MCVQLLTFEMTTGKSQPLQFIIPVIEHRRMFKFMIGFFGIWNLDYIRYALPPFCVSESLSFSHVAFLGYVSTFYPFLLTFLTWTFIKLYDQNIKPLVWLCTLSYKFRYLGRLQRLLNVRKGLVSCVTSFFLLSYTKLLFQSVFLLYCPVMYTFYGKEVTKERIPNYDPTSEKCMNIYCEFSYLYTDFDNFQHHPSYVIDPLFL